ncbi:jerky protein [Caerostris extrusa]|uniref:Jerky protein n=1 Tax=Caerostris extrusa TaxID=172846 RepID=A0AAV4WID5_CAEEX|nr:jerky protein [Caerostris extrusa]
MFDCENNPFEIKNNELLFEETCEKLKHHPFESPWKLCFPIVDQETPDIICGVHELDLPELTELNTPVTEQKGNTSKDTFLIGSIDVIKTEDNTLKTFEVKLLAIKESLINIKTVSTSVHVNGIEILNSINLSQVCQLCKVLQTSFENEAALIAFMNCILNFEKPLSLSIANALVKNIIYPQIFEIKQNSSRNLLAAVLNFSELYPKPIIDEIIIPFLKKSLETLQLETLMKMVKSNLPNEYVCYCIKNILEQSIPVDSTFSILQILIERKIHQEYSLLDTLTRKMESWSPSNKNVKFIKLLISILIAYGSELDLQLLMIYDDMIEKNETIMKRAAENVIKKMKTKCV